MFTCSGSIGGLGLELEFRPEPVQSTRSPHARRRFFELKNGRTQRRLRVARLGGLQRRSPP